MDEQLVQGWKEQLELSISNKEVIDLETATDKLSQLVVGEVCDHIDQGFATTEEDVGMYILTFALYASMVVREDASMLLYKNIICKIDEELLYSHLRSKLGTAL